MLDAVDGVEQRVQVLADLRSNEGYLAEAVAGDGGEVLLVEHHCPIGDAASSCEHLCAAELDVFRTAVERANSSNNILKLTASKDELAQLEQALKQSEQHREADKKWFIEQLKELGKVISTPPTPPVRA